jgi:putative SOS response-associated peptidase YedK
MINARAETVATNRSFQPSFENHRCLVVADGFFEWKREGAAKKPYYIHLKNGDPMGFAGLYNNWISPEGEEICTCTIVTTDANDALADIHERMPVIAPAEDYGLWLDPSLHDKETLLPLLKPYPSDKLEIYPVTPRMNSFKYNDPSNITPMAMTTSPKEPKARKHTTEH